MPWPYAVTLFLDSSYLPFTLLTVWNCLFFQVNSQAVSLPCPVVAIFYSNINKQDLVPSETAHAALAGARVWPVM